MNWVICFFTLLCLYRHGVAEQLKFRTIEMEKEGLVENIEVGMPIIRLACAFCFPLYTCGWVWWCHGGKRMDPIIEPC